MVTRRSLLIALGAGAFPAPFASSAQQLPKTWRIGFLTPRPRPTSSNRDAFADAFTQGMRELGYAEGKNLVIEWRYVDGKYDSLPELAAELVRMEVDVIVTYGTAAAQVLKKATGRIPIVIAAAVDIVGSGLVESLSRPGGNVTGLSAIAVDLSSKQLELLNTMMPKLSRVAVLVNPGNPAHPAVVKNLQPAAKGLGIEVSPLEARAPEQIDAGFAAMARDRVDGVIVAADALFSGQGPRIADLAIRNRIATISVYDEHVLAGTLMSYGQSIAGFHRHAALYVDRVLKGTKPANLPVEQPTKIDFLINSRTAKFLGLEVPQELLVRANGVIE